MPEMSTEINQLPQPKTPKFVHLRVHSDFSMVDGLTKVKPLVAKTAALNMPALAID